MKILAIGDTHGRKNWRKLVDEEFDKLIFIGDYFDSRDDINGLKQLNNFNAIVSLKKQNPNSVELLLGNHDYHYLRGVHDRYSGFQPERMIDFQIVLEEALKEDLIKICHNENGILFTHAGLTKTWCENNGINISKRDIFINNPADVEKQVNDLFKMDRTAFAFNPHRIISNPDLYGNNPEQGPLWVRHESLEKDAVMTELQVIGHTQTNELYYNEFGNFIGIDCVYKNFYLEIDYVEEVSDFSFEPKVFPD